ncbi:hypothetical protein LJR009_001623 [Bosea sp. LjRoot9]|uniref:hypothetical protein n=1 Tax=Bosea sp. LjRoot9 TaxID=3342341 RepID=UPI003ED03E0F
MLRLILPVILAMTAPALAQSPRFLSCDNAKEPAYCRQAQAQQRSEAAEPKTYTTRRNTAFCLWTGCDGAIAIDRKASCEIRRAIMKQYPKEVDRGDDQHFANCVNAGY